MIAIGRPSPDHAARQLAGLDPIARPVRIATAPRREAGPGNSQDSPPARGCKERVGGSRSRLLARHPARRVTLQDRI
jgi:hypothetical protein